MLYGQVRAVYVKLWTKNILTSDISTDVIEFAELMADNS